MDYQEVFAPVANLDSVRTLIALAAKHDLELEQMDVSTAYPNGELEEDLYMLPPDGVSIQPGYCWKLQRSLYELKQAGQTWNKILDRKLGELGFTRLDAETCLYVFRKNGQVCFLVVYVDNLLLAATTQNFMDSIKAKLSASFKMWDLGEAKYILGIEIKRNRKLRTISLSQSQYSRTVLERTGMSTCKPVWTPMAHNSQLSMTDPEDDRIIPEQVIEGRQVSYLTIIGSLMYLMLGTRPDIAYAVGTLSHFSAKPKLAHWEAAKRVLRYIQATKDMELRFDGTELSMDLDFHGYTDAGWSQDPDNSRSTSGFLFMSNRGPISWSSKQQSMVALSTTESEYIGLSNAGQHLAWLRTFFDEIGHPQKGPTQLFCDNQAAIILSRDPQFQA